MSTGVYDADMLDANLYDSDNNGSGYSDEIVPGKIGNNRYRSLNNNVNDNTENKEESDEDDEISRAFMEETGTDENGLGYGGEEEDSYWEEE
jgi:hypothetical protein